MTKAELVQHIETLKGKLNRAQRQMTGLRQKSKYLEMQYEDARNREGNNNELVMELIERQRELNVMLNRANIMLNRTQEAMALSSMELNEMAKALPEPKKAEWADRVSRVNELFKQTGVQDAELEAVNNVNPNPEVSLDTDELKRESEEAFGRKQPIWERKEKHDPPRVHAEVVEEDSAPDRPGDNIRLVGNDTPSASSEAEPETEQVAREPAEQSEDDALYVPPKRKSWWRKPA